MGIGGVLGHFLLNFLYMGPILEHEIDVGQECAVSVPIYFPMFANFGFIGGLLFIIAAIGFFQKTKWAYTFAILGNVISLKASFWPNIPIMEAGILAPGPWFGIFLPNLIFYFILLRVMGKESWKKILLGLFGGMAFILNFINAIASTTRLMNHYDPNNIIVAQMFMLVLVINMLASLAFGTFVIGLFVSNKKELIRVAGLIGAVLAITGGFPLAIYSMFFFHVESAFSMFIIAPVISTVTMIVPLFPGLWNRFTEPR
ncbi:MAG: hypothetical protein JW776_12930 [Candidatus Lokiarchaeota archaeon]|nr:hypothetical protein [Candidatus Lokiarchaeota archaeon]